MLPCVLSPPQRPLCVVGRLFVLWGGSLCYFFDYWYFDGDTQREPLRRREPCVYSVCSVIDQWWRQNVVKTKKWHKSRRRVCHWCFYLIFDVIADLLLNRPTATWNLFVLYNDQKRKKTDTHTCLTPLDCSRICASLGNFSQTLLVASSSSFFVILIAYSFLEEFFKVFFCSKHGENILQIRESLVAMTHDGNCCEDFLWFRHSEVVKNSFASISPFFFFVNSSC